MIESILISSSFLFTAYLYSQNKWGEISNHTIISKTLSKPLTFIHLSDIHGCKVTKGFINKIKSIAPNSIFITGDGIDSYRGGLSNLCTLASTLTNISTVYYVLGNHESRLDNLQNFIETIESTGIIVLRNSGIFNSDLDINIVGINDPAFRNYVTTTKPSYISTIYKNIIKDLDISKFTLLLCHRPEILTTYSDLGPNLVLTGHGHGGQVRLPFIGGLFTPSEGLFPKFTSGIHKQDNTNMIISRGVGNSAFPFRINNRPEIVKINLIPDS